MTAHSAVSALQALEEAAAEHLSWLKQVHAALIFGENTPPPPLPMPEVVRTWSEMPDVSPAQAQERQAACARLRTARRHMNERAAALTGRPMSPEGYHAFMTSAEAYGRELRRIEAMMHQAVAEIDPLTGVQNRRGMMRDLQREWQRAVRTGQPCCIALVDLDHFKAINDTYGHCVGDRVLGIAARFFVRRLRPYDRVYRYGGEEFLFVLPNTDLRLAERVLHRLRLLMARVPVALGDGRRTCVTASIGLAEMSRPGCGPEVALKRADAAVYAAKEAGRNRVLVYEDACCDDSAVADELRRAVSAEDRPGARM